MITLNDIREKIIFLNGVLSSIAILNNTPNSSKDYGFAELDSTASNLTESLRNFLETPKWDFGFKKLNENWKEMVLQESSWAFTDFITKQFGLASQIGIEKYEYLLEKNNAKSIQTFLFHYIETFLKPFEICEVYKIEIQSIPSNDYSGYFAHGECNYLFKTKEGKIFLLFFRASD